MQYSPNIPRPLYALCVVSGFFQQFCHSFVFLVGFAADLGCVLVYPPTLFSFPVQSLQRLLLRLHFVIALSPLSLVGRLPAPGLIVAI
jgi:hypothetical protein